MNNKYKMKITKKCECQKNNDTNSKPGLMHFATPIIVAYLLAEIVIQTGISQGYPSLNEMGGINNYAFTTSREGELSLHLIFQSLALPAHFITTRKSMPYIIKEHGALRIRDALLGLIVSATSLWFLYAPARPATNPDLYKFNIIQILASKSNFAYSLLIGMSVAIASMGAQTLICFFIKKFRKSCDCSNCNINH